MIPPWWVPLDDDPADEEEQPEWLIGEVKEQWEFWQGKIALI